MKLIGITGKSGAGKTTFSNYLAKDEKIGVIHVDDILKEIKLKYFKHVMKEDKQGEKVKVDSKLKTFIYKNPVIFPLFMKFRARLVEKPLKAKIEEMKLSQKEMVLIDDIFLKYHRLYQNLDRVILIERPFRERKRSLIERDGLSKEEVVACDIAHYTGNYKELTHSPKVIKITNNGNKEELEKVAEQISKTELGKKRENVRTRCKVILQSAGKEKTPRLKSKNRKGEQHETGNR